MGGHADHPKETRIQRMCGKKERKKRKILSALFERSHRTRSRAAVAAGDKFNVSSKPPRTRAALKEMDPLQKPPGISSQLT